MKKEFIFLLSLFLSLHCTGQSAFMNERGIKVNLFSGYHYAANPVWKTKQSMDGPVIGLDLALVQWGIKKEKFKLIYGTPRIGLDLRLIKMNNTDTFGYCIALLPSIEMELIHRLNWSLQTKISFGINGNTDGFDSLRNFDNRAISSSINFGFDIGLMAHATIHPGLEINLGTGLYHVSNGSFKMPNGGINILYVNAGLNYYPYLDIKKAYLKKNYKFTGKRFYYMGYGAFAYKQQRYFSDMTKFWVFSLVNQGMFKVNQVYSTGFGLDAFYDATQPLKNNSTDRLASIPEYKKYYLAMGFTNRFDIGKFFIPAGIYGYLYNYKYIKEPVYFRFGLGYQISKHLFTGIFYKGTIDNKLKLESDFMEWSLGLKL